MITTKKMNSFKQKHFTGESTDNKPTTCGVNSLFVEIDTGDTYFFDGYQWIKAELPEHGGITPTGNIAITENTAEGSPLNIAQYATATVNVSGGGGLPTMALTIINNTGEELVANYDGGISYEISNSYGIDALATVIEINETYEANVLYNYVPGLFDDPDEFNIRFCYVYGDFVTTLPSATNLNNCTFSTDGGAVKLVITDPSLPSSATVTLRTNLQ